MNIQRIYLGTWLPRTSIHLNEVYLFLKNGSSLHLNEEELAPLRKKLNPQNLLYTYRPEFDDIVFTSENITVTMTEDGVILIQLDDVEDIDADTKKIGAFYTQKLGPALAFLFRHGAPLPQTLLEIEDVYPKILVGKNMKDKEVDVYLKKEKDELLAKVSLENIDLYYGQESEFIDITRTIVSKKYEEELGQLLTYTVFVRTFSVFLEEYLQLHRTIWTQITTIRENENMRYRDFSHVRNTILEILKTISFVRARLKQMNDVLALRSDLAPEVLKQRLFAHGLNNFIALEKSYQYMDSLWQMTADYGNSTMTLYASLLDENTEREIRMLQMITITGTLVGFFGMNIAFPWETEWNKEFLYSFAVVGIMLLALMAAYILIKKLILNRRFPVVNKKDLTMKDI